MGLEPNFSTKNLTVHLKFVQQKIEPKKEILENELRMLIKQTTWISLTNNESVKNATTIAIGNNEQTAKNFPYASSVIKYLMNVYFKISSLTHVLDKEQ